MATNEDIITGIEQREGGSAVTNDPADPGGLTQWGISQRSNPEAWKDDKVTEAEARNIYEQKYLKGPKFDQIKDFGLRSQLVDFGVNSGPMVAIQKLQIILGVNVDGILGPNTLDAIKDARQVGNALVDARVLMICKLVQKSPAMLKDLVGLVNRALQFRS